MLSADGWFHFADRRWIGPVGKYYTEVNGQHGIVFHSAEGGLPALIGELMKPDRQASWCGSIDKDGTLYQHYATHRSCWTSGNKKANTSYYAFEAVGRRGEPLTKAQEDTVLRIIEDGAAAGGWKPERKVTIWEHNEVATIAKPNAGPTACPSNRYDAVWARLEGDAMTPEEKEAFGKLLFEHTLLLEWCAGTAGEADDSQAKARERIGTRIRAMRAGTGGSFAETVQGHIENSDAHGGK